MGRERTAGEKTKTPSVEMKKIELETVEKKIPEPKREKVELQIAEAHKADASDAAAVGSYAEKRKKLLELAGELKAGGDAGREGAGAGDKGREVAGVKDTPSKFASSAGSEKGAMNDVPAFASNRERVRETLSKARDTEAETVLNDLLRKTEEEARALNSDEKGQIVHRRYMLKGGEEGEGVSVFARKETTEKENFDRLVQDVYVQLKSSKKEEKLRDAVGVSAPRSSKPKEGKTEGKAEITFNDLLGEHEEGVGKVADSATAGDLSEEGQGRSSIFSQLESIASGKGKVASAQSSIEFVKMVGEKGMGCPTCHSNSSRIIFCPYCGTGLCANCSPKIKPEPEGFLYTCPKCKEEITIRKKAMAAAS